MVSVNELLDVMRQAGFESPVIDALKSDQPLLKQGLDSVDYPAFAAALEDRYKVSIGDKDAFSLRTLDDFSRFIDKHTRP